MTFEQVMAAVATAPATNPADDLRRLREAFIKRAGRISESELSRFSDMAIALLGRVPLIERMAFGRRIAKNRNTPRALLAILTNDHFLVSAPVLEDAPMLTEPELLDIIERHGQAVYLAIAKRDELSIELTDRLMAEADGKVHQTLAGNTGARLSRKSLIALCDLAQEDDDLRTLLSGRRDLPTALAARLRSSGSRDDAPAAPPIIQKSAAPGRGRAGVVLSADMMTVKPRAAGPKTFRYS